MLRYGKLWKHTVKSSINAGFAGKLRTEWWVAMGPGHFFLGGKSYMIMSRAKVTSLKDKKKLEKRRETTLLFLFHPWHPLLPGFFPQPFFRPAQDNSGDMDLEGFDVETFMEMVNAAGLRFHKTCDEREDAPNGSPDHSCHV